MTVFQYILAFVLIALGIIIVALVMLQESKQQGLSGAIAGAADTFFGKNKGRTKEAQLAKLTKIAGAIYFILTFVASLLVLFTANN